MDLPEAIDLCLSLPGSGQSTPFGPDTLVFKVRGKIFALTDPSAFPPRMNLKCDPARSIELREIHDSIQPGYHMNKRHWITIQLDGTLPPDLIHELIVDSHGLIIASLPKKRRETLGNQH